MCRGGFSSGALDGTSAVRHGEGWVGGRSRLVPTPPVLRVGEGRGGDDAGRVEG